LDLEWLILADAAQVVGNKLYLMGGGWDTVNVNGPLPVTQRCAVAASFTVPWPETNRRHNVSIDISTEDGQLIAEVNGQVEVGRPVGIPPGASQRAQLAADLALPIHSPGVIVIVAKIEGKEAGRLTFRVVPMQASA
jgi:hypothetical protein